MSWSNNRICQLLELEHPIILAPMAGATTSSLVAAVSNAGGLGSFGAAATPPDRLAQTIRTIRQQTDKPFNINLFSPVWEPLEIDAAKASRMQQILAPLHAELEAGAVPKAKALFGPYDEQLAVMLEEKVPVMSFHFGVSEDTMEKAKSAGIKVLCSATTVGEAYRLEELGVDIIIAQGSEAGGHRGTFDGDWRDALIGSLALTPQIVDAVRVPVVSAGGIMDGRGLAACLALGADAVQLGTAFLACAENNIAPAYREALLTSDAQRPVVTEVFSGKPARGLRNRYLEEMTEHEAELLPFPAQYAVFGAIRAKATTIDDGEFLPMWSGQGVGLVQAMPAAKLVDKVATQALSIMGRLGECAI